MMARPNIDEQVMDDLATVVDELSDVDPSMLTTQQKIEYLLKVVSDRGGGDSEGSSIDGTKASKQIPRAAEIEGRTQRGRKF